MRAFVYLSIVCTIISCKIVQQESKLQTKETTSTILEEYRNSTRPLRSMIDNQALTGWHILGNGEWTYYYGELRGYSGEQPSYLVTDKSYKNFYLIGEFKIEKEDNSGIFIRKHPDSTNVSLQDAIECNIYDSDGEKQVYSTGSIVTHALAPRDLIQYGTWNTMEIFAKNEQVILCINGQPSAEAHLPHPFDKAGNICLQSGTRLYTDNGPSTVYFKNLRIREME